jgi:hypothetical protein
MGRRLLALCAEQDVVGLSQLIDRLLADYPEAVWQNTLAETTHQISLSEGNTADSDQSIFWETALLPRLYSRLYLTLRETAQPSRPILLGLQADTSPVYALISALKLVLKGYYPIVRHQPVTPDGALVTLLQSLQCMGVGIVDASGRCDFDPWHNWHQKHGSFELYFFTDQSPGSASQALLAHHFPLTPD